MSEGSSSTSLSIQIDDSDSTIKNIVDIMIVLPNKQKYGLIFVYDVFTVDEYENIKNILKTFFTANCTNFCISLKLL